MSANSLDLEDWQGCTGKLAAFQRLTVAIIDCDGKRLPQKAGALVLSKEWSLQDAWLEVQNGGLIGSPRSKLLEKIVQHEEDLSIFMNRLQPETSRLLVASILPKEVGVLTKS